jgi:hypothetical protein
MADTFSFALRGLPSLARMALGWLRYRVPKAGVP